MTFSQKETGLLKDLKEQEQLCCEKYSKYAHIACAQELKSLFGEIARSEQSHLNTVNAMLGGAVPNVPSGLTGKNNSCCQKVSYTDCESCDIDRFLVTDMLAMEKHVSSIYDTSVFEFKDPNARKMLNHIQAEEQQHGEQLYAYMNANGMYQG